jgi:hypothetical protein
MPNFDAFVPKQPFLENLNYFSGQVWELKMSISQILVLSF